MDNILMALNEWGEGTGGRKLGRVGAGRGTGGGRGKGGREAGVLSGREAGEKCEMLIFLIQQCVTIRSERRTQNIFELHLTSSLSLLRLLSKRANENLRLG